MPERRSRHRVAVVVSHPIQHFAPLYRAIALDDRVDLKVFFGSTAGLVPYFDVDYQTTVQWQPDLVAGYEHEFLPGATSVVDLSRPVGNRHLWSRLSASRPDAVVIYGFHHWMSRAALTWGLLHKRRIVYVADSELRTKRPFASRLRKRLSLPLLFSLVDSFLTIGDCNEEYYRFYGVNPQRFVRSPYPIDDARLGAARDARRELRREFRESRGIAEDEFVILTVGKLTRRKRPADVVEAVRLLQRRGRRGAVVVFAGDGPEAESLRTLAAECNGAVRFEGFVNVTDLPAYYASADVLVHPSSQDPHPLATSEAVFTGLPVIVSDRVGSVGPTDDVRLEQNGLSYPCGDVRMLTDCLETLIDDPSRRGAMATASLAIASERTLAASLEGFVRGCRP